ncbi:hypothetical protein AAVH_33291, partial [Aphelenchoides avenae]
VMLLLLFFVNLGNMLSWVLWSLKMKSRKHRRNYVLKKWLNHKNIDPNAYDCADEFAASFRVSNLLIFYFIEAHTDRVVASAFCTALFKRRLQHECRLKFGIAMPKDDPNEDEQIGNVGRSVESLSVESILTLESQSIVLAGISSPNAKEGNDTQLLPQSPQCHTSSGQGELTSQLSEVEKSSPDDDQPVQESKESKCAVM